MKCRFGPRCYIPPPGGLGDRYLPRVKRSCEAGLNREAVQAAEQFLVRGYIPPLGGLGGECNEVDFGNGLNEVRVKPGDKRHLIARVRREKTNGENNQ